MMIVACAVPWKRLLRHPNRMFVRNAFLNTAVIPHIANHHAPWKEGGRTDEGIILAKIALRASPLSILGQRCVSYAKQQLSNGKCLPPLSMDNENPCNLSLSYVKRLQVCDSYNYLAGCH